MDAKVKISGGFYIGLAAMVLLLPVQWILAAIAAAVFHELCHYLAIFLCTGTRSSLRIFSFGAQLPLPAMGLGKELFCSLAGPLGGLFLLLFARWLPRLAICAAFQSAFNLLPIYPLDGGRSLYCLLHLLFPATRAEHAAHITESVILLGVIFAAGYSFFVLGLGIIPATMVCILILRVKFAKMPCKVSPLQVQ